MLRRMYDWCIAAAHKAYAKWVLGIVSFVESSFFPIPPDVLMIPMIISRPSRAWIVATVAMVTSVLGGLLGYFIGAVLWDTVGQPILEFYGKTDAGAKFAQEFNQYGAWAVLFAGVTPFPFKVITIVSGWTGLSLPVFILSAIVARGLRFYVVAALLWKYGAPIRDFVERRLGLMFTVFMVLLIGGFALIKYL